jgi:hypothetical protein
MNAQAAVVDTVAAATNLDGRPHVEGNDGSTRSWSVVDARAIGQQDYAQGTIW